LERIASAFAAGEVVIGERHDPDLTSSNRLRLCVGLPGYGDVWSRRGSELQTEEAFRRIKAHPWNYAGRVAIHVPKLWVSTSTRLWILSVLYLGGFLVLGLADAWTVRRDARFYPLIVAIAVNWAFLLPFPGEARRTLPLRLPMLLLAGIFVGPQLERFARRTRFASIALARPHEPRDQAGSS
jgi:hypothetical protein